MNNPARHGPHLAIGLCFVLLGLALLADRLDLLDVTRVLHYWPVALVILGLGMIAGAVRGRDDGRGNGFPVGAIVVLVLIGLFASHVFEGRSTRARRGVQDDVRLSAVFGGRRAAVTDAFREAHITSLMGGTVLDLRQATVPPGEVAVIDVFTLMGGTVIHVPPHWVVDVQSTAIMGGVKDERTESATPRVRRGRRGDPEPTPDPGVEPNDSAVPPSPVAADEAIERPDEGPAVATDRDAPRLVVRGFVLMGGLNIKP